MKANRAVYPVAMLCRLLDVSTSGYYAWLKRPPSRRAQEEAILTERIGAIHHWSRGTYGAPRVYDELKDEGVRIGRKRVARLMQAAGLQGVSRRKAMRTTVRKPGVPPAPDLVDRDFTADRPDELWVADITYIRTWAGFLYLAVVMDAFSRRIVGWAMANHLRTELVLDALDMALRQRKPLGVIHHSDQGSQYTSLAFGKHCREAGVRPSMGSVGGAYDNALCESFFATLECELLDRHSFRSQDQAAEKAVKALHLRLGQEAWGHVVAQLLRELPPGTAGFSEMLIERAKVLDNFYISARYPNAHPAGAPFEHFGTLQSEQALEHAGAILDFVRSAMA